MERKELSMHRCRLCGRYPELCYRYVTRAGNYSSLSCIGTVKGVDHTILLVGKSVDSLVMAWNELNGKELTDGT